MGGFLKSNKKKRFSLHIWKEKAIQRRLENKKLKKKIIELEFSRDMWKRRAMTNKNDFTKSYSELEQIKKKMRKILL